MSRVLVCARRLCGGSLGGSAIVEVCRMGAGGVRFQSVGALPTIFLALGVGVGVGMLAGTTGLQGSARGRMTLLAAIIALVLAALAASVKDGSVVLGALGGFLGSGIACVVVSDLVFAASRREGAASGAIGFLIGLAALAVIGVSFLLPILALGPLVALLWVGTARRRRARRKYEGLRVLR